MRTGFKRRFLSDHELGLLAQHFISLGLHSGEMLLAVTGMRDTVHPREYEKTVFDAIVAIERAGLLEPLLDRIASHFRDQRTPALQEFAAAIGIEIYEAALASDEGFFDLAHVPARLLEALAHISALISGWVVRIEDHGTPIAHGIIVGPDLVLTCRHSLEDPESVDSLQVSFAVAGRKRSFGLSKVAPLPFGADRFKSLDAVFLRLNQRVSETAYAPDGPARGWFSLCRSKTESSGAEVIVYAAAPHHETEVWETISRGPGATRPAEDGKMLVHNSPTVSGDSGGVVLDEALFPIGLHIDVCELGVAGATDRDGDVKPGERRGCKFSMLWRHICDQGLHRQFAHYCDAKLPWPHAHEPTIFRLSDEGDPVFDRELFQRLVWTIGRHPPNDDRTVVEVHGDSGSGLSFSRKIIEAIVERFGQSVAHIEGAAFITDRGVAICARVLDALHQRGILSHPIQRDRLVPIAVPRQDALGLRRSLEAFAEGKDAPDASDESDDLRGLGLTFEVRSNPQTREVKILSEMVARVLREEFEARPEPAPRSWVIFDNLNAPHLTEEVRQLLEWIASALSNFPNFTVVMIGADAVGVVERPRIPGVEELGKGRIRDRVRPPTQAELERFFAQAWAAAHAPKGPGDAVMAADRLLSLAEGKQGHAFMEIIVNEAKSILNW